LVTQKTQSLQAYNQAVPEEELLDFLSQHVGASAMSPDAFGAMTELMTHEIIPRLWREGQQRSADARFVTHRAMASVIREHYPRTLIANADVVLFPDDKDLRTVIAEAPQDHFRDSGWHWRWIGLTMDSLSPNQQRALKELDVYAAEELSELLSVLAVGMVQLAVRDDLRAAGPVDAYAIQHAYQSMLNRSLAAAKSSEDGNAIANATRPSPHAGYSPDTKRQLLLMAAQPMFREVSGSLGVDYMHSPNLDLMLRRIHLKIPLGLAGGGVAAGDFDDDGYVDLYFAGDRAGGLYRNVEGAQFVGVTVEAGVRPEGESRAGYFVDYDNDGDLDLYITFVGQSNRLYENDGGGRFTDVTDAVGLAGGKDTTHEAVWFDMDNDGLLDLYTASFGNWAEGAVPTLGRINTNGGPNRLYHHRLVDGQHRFTEVGSQLGVDDRGWTHCVAALDFDQDGYMDLFSLNDFGTSLVYRNIEGTRFTELSRQLHLDTIYNAMNFTLLDVTHDGHPSIYVSQIMKLTHRQRYRRPTEQTEMVFTPESIENLRTLVTNRLYEWRPDGTYADTHDQRLEPAELGWAWDASALDYENDGDPDLLVLNGTESKVPGDRRGGTQEHVEGRLFLLRHAEQQNVFYMSQDGYFYDVSQQCPLAYRGNSRGSTFFDFDNDGDLDVAANDYNASCKVFENLQRAGHHWIRFRLEGTRSNSRAIGARVEVRFGDERRYDQVVSRSGFLSQNPLELHFGLGAANRVDKLIVTWPSGSVQELFDFVADQTHVIEEP
jgi:hypothetical protein